MRYELVVFDWDGTLMDSEARIVACMQAAAGDTGLAVPGHDATKDIIGLGLVEAIQALFPGEDGGTHDRIGDAYRRHWLGDELAPAPLFRGAAEVLATLDQAGYLLAVATGKSRRGLDRALQESGLGQHFVATRCADETFSKPHPQMLLDILDRTGMSAARTLVIGDTEYDMQMAANAGADALGIGHGVHAVERLLASGALGCLDDLWQLTGWLSARAGGGQSNNTG